HLEDLQSSGGEHLVELAAQRFARLAMQDVEDRATDRLLTRDALHSSFALAIPDGNSILPIDHVEPNGKRVDDPFGDAAFAIDLARPLDHLRLETLGIGGLSEHGRENVGDGGEE